MSFNEIICHNCAVVASNGDDGGLHPEALSQVDTDIERVYVDSVSGPDYGWDDYECDGCGEVVGDMSWAASIERKSCEEIGHEWSGQVEYGPITGNPHRKCNHCLTITPDLED